MKIIYWGVKCPLNGFKMMFLFAARIFLKGVISLQNWDFATFFFCYWKRCSANKKLCQCLNSRSKWYCLRLYDWIELDWSLNFISEFAGSKKAHLRNQTWWKKQDFFHFCYCHSLTSVIRNISRSTYDRWLK